MGWLEHSCLPSSSNRPFIPHNNSSKFLLFSLLSVNLVKGTGADIVDPPRLRPHLPRVQLVQDRGSVGGGGRILPRERRVPVHTPRREDDALARTAPRGIVLGIIVPQGGLARGLPREGPPFQDKVSLSFLFPLPPVNSDRIRRQRHPHQRRRHIHMSSGSLSRLHRLPVSPVLSNLGSFNLGYFNLGCFNPVSSNLEMS